MSMGLVAPARYLRANPLISPFSRNSSIAVAYAAQGLGAAAASAAWPSANLRFYYPFQLFYPETLLKFWWANGATVGTNNLQCAVYNDDLTLLKAGTSTLSATANVVQEDDITDTFMPPGHYYMSISCNGTTPTLLRTAPTANNSLMLGYYSQASAFTPPDPMVPASLGTTNNQIWLFGLAFRTVAA